MIQTLTIALWSHLFCGAWSESGKVFGWLKAWASKHLPYVVRHPLVECAVCHAVWASIVVNGVCVAQGGRFTVETALSVLGASYAALLFDDFAELRDKWKNT